ncbi:hypothetical protein CBG52_12085, partial [Fusobacterium polymorphum]
FFKLKMTLNYKNCFLVSFFLLGLNYLICNSPNFFTYKFYIQKKLQHFLQLVWSFHLLYIYLI